MKLALLLFAFSGMASAVCGYDPLLKRLTCPPGPVADGGAFEAAFAAATGLTVTAATHGLGENVWGVCVDNATPTNTIVQTAGFPTVAANGDVVFAWTGSKTGVCYVTTLGAGPAGPAGAQGIQGVPGDPGATGAVGPGYAATSTTSLLIGTGSKSFTTQAGLAYAAGVRAKATSAANAANFMHGLVTSYSGTTLVINVDTVGGSGTLADWNITLQGDTGATGATGAQGPAGSVSVVGAGTLTSTAIVTGGGTQLIQTPTGATVDADGDAIFKSVTTGDTSAAGAITLSELAANGNNFRKRSVPDTLTADLDSRDPDALPTEGQIMKWSAPSSGVSQGSYVTPSAKIWLPAASCQNTTAGLLWDTPTSGPAVAACVTGTNTQKGVADFADSASLSMQLTLALPSDFVSTIDAKFKWLTTATSGSVVWQIATICVADAETDDPAFNTASTVTDAAKGTTNQTNDATITGVTITGCAAGELLHVKVLRDAAHASDDLAATARLIGVELTTRRTF